MSGQQDRAPDDLFEKIEDQAIDDELERVLGLSDAQLDAELTQAGVDPTQVRAQGAELGRRLEAGRAPGAAPPVPMPLRRRWARWAPAAAVATALAAPLALGTAALVARDAPTPIRPDDSALALRPTVKERAVGMRTQALAACERQDWAACSQGLDQAAALDPSGDSESSVVAAREQIRNATAPPPAPAPHDGPLKPPAGR